LSQSGIKDFDLLIGTTAIQCGFVLATGNVKHFEQMQNLTIEHGTQ